MQAAIKYGPPLLSASKETMRINFYARQKPYAMLQQEQINEMGGKMRK
jgi:hypothetical protein